MIRCDTAGQRKVKAEWEGKGKGADQFGGTTVIFLLKA